MPSSLRYISFCLQIVLIFLTISNSVLNSKLDDRVDAGNHKREHWLTSRRDSSNQTIRAELREALDGASTQLQHNLVFVLTELGRDAVRIGKTIKFAIKTLVNALVNGTFQLSGIVASAPQILTEDLPIQLKLILKTFQQNENVSNELNVTLGTVITFLEETENGTLSLNIFRPVTRILPNLLAGLNRFLVAIMNGLFFLIGARDPSIYYATTTLSPLKNNTNST